MPAIVRTYVILSVFIFDSFFHSLRAIAPRQPFLLQCSYRNT